MTSMKLTTTSTLTGIGVHSGLPVTITLKPRDQGIVFVRTDKNNSIIPARWDTVVDTRNCTTIGNSDGVTVSTIEHLMAALAAFGIEDALVEIDGPEMPIMDGSAKDYYTLVEEARPQTSLTPRRVFKILKDIVVEGDGGRSASLTPSDHYALEVEFDFGGRVALPKQVVSFTPFKDDFSKWVGPARTFGLLEDAEKIKAMGLAKGASLENTVVFDGTSVMNEGGLRFEDECGRHKVLDAMGDLHLAGGLILGHYKGVHTGHTMNNQLLRKLFADSSAYVEEPIAEVI